MNTCWRRIRTKTDKKPTADGFKQKHIAGWAWTKTDKNTASVFRVFDLLYIHTKPYESKLLTALYERKAVARCATRKTDTAINRIKTSGAHKLRIENTYGCKHVPNVFYVYCPIVGKCCFAAQSICLRVDVESLLS